MPQTTIGLEPVELLAGMHARPHLTDDIFTQVVSQTGGMAYGVFASRAAEGKIKYPTSQAEVDASGIGILMRDPSNETPASPGTPGVWPNGEVVPVMRHGYVGVVCETDATAEGQVFVRITAAGGNTQLGAVRKDADGGNAILLPRARFHRSLAAAGVAEVEVW